MGHAVWARSASPELHRRSPWPCITQPVFVFAICPFVLNSCWCSMSELRQIVALWCEAKARQEEVCLATVIRVEGSSYRKPGARMLLTSGGQRAGTISGGCLEAEVAKKAWWLTEKGPTVQRYSSFFDDDSSAPY